MLTDRVGTDPDPMRTQGRDSIDPLRTIDGLRRLRDRVRKAAARRERVLLAAGHPGSPPGARLGSGRRHRAHSRCGVCVRRPGIELCGCGSDVLVEIHLRRRCTVRWYLAQT